MLGEPSLSGQTKVQYSYPEPEHKKPPCKVCECPHARLAFGVILCMRCTSFYRRSILLKLKYHCQKDGKCFIDVKRPTVCKACRLKKCEAVGLDKHCITPRRTNRFEEPKNLESDGDGELEMMEMNEDFKEKLTTFEVPAKNLPDLETPPASFYRTFF